DPVATAFGLRASCALRVGALASLASAPRSGTSPPKCCGDGAAVELGPVPASRGGVSAPILWTGSSGAVTEAWARGAEVDLALPCDDVWEPAPALVSGVGAGAAPVWSRRTRASAVAHLTRRTSRTILGW